MRIGTNVAAIVANNALQKSQNNLSTSIERLSSGYKINGSKDDAAGCAISEKMRAQIRGLSQAQNLAFRLLMMLIQMMKEKLYRKR